MKATWKRLISDAEPLRRSSHSLSIIGQRAYVFGGELKPREPRDNDVYAIDLNATANSHEHGIHTLTFPTAPTPRVGAASTILDGDVYIFGGRGGPSMTCLPSSGSFAVFNAGNSPTPAWSNLTPSTDSPIPEDRSYHAMTSDRQSTIYLHAGCPTKGRLNDLWACNVATKEWKQLASAPGNSRGGTSIAFSSTTSKIYRMNGFDGTTEQGGSIDVYDPEFNAWSSITFQSDGVHGPEPRSVCTLLAIRSKTGQEYLLTMFGEGTPSDLGHAGAGRMYGDVWAWHLTGERWLRVETDGPSPEPRGWFGADVLRGVNGEGDKIAVHGGLRDDNQRLDDVWVLQFN